MTILSHLTLNLLYHTVPRHSIVSNTIYEIRKQNMTSLLKNTNNYRRLRVKMKYVLISAEIYHNRGSCRVLFN